MTYDYSSRRLEIRRPPILSSIARACGGLLILLVVVVGIMTNIKYILKIYDMLSGGNLDPSQVFGIVFILTSFFYLPGLLASTITGLVGGIKHTLRGLGEIVTPFKPANIPCDLRDYAEAMNALRQRAVSIYQPVEPFLSGLFGANTLFLAPVARKVFNENGQRLKKRIPNLIIAGIFLGITFFLFTWGNNQPGNDKYTLLLQNKAAQGTVYIPFLTILFLQIIVGLIELVTNFILVPRRQPDTVALEGHQHYRGFGHPSQLFSRLPVLANSLRLEGFLNRNKTVWDEAAMHSVGDVGGFKGNLLVEQQPWPFPGFRDAIGYALIFVGWLTCLAAFVVYFFIVPTAFNRVDLSRQDYIYAPVATFLWLLVASTLASTSNHTLSQGSTLLESTTFRSNSILVDITGNLARADVKVGKSITDSIESSNVTVRSDFSASFWAAELVSEAARLDAPRDLLAFSITPLSQQWMDFFQREINSLREEKVKPVGVDLASSEVNELVQANVGVSAMKVAANSEARQAQLLRKEDRPSLAEKVGAGVNPLAGPKVCPFCQTVNPPQNSICQNCGGALPVDSGDFKECPDCGEMVRVKARKCRFCGHMFEQVTTS